MKTLMVWGVLIAGVMVLAGMAWRIWREVKRRRSISHKTRVFAGFRKPCRLQAGYVLRQVFSYAVWGSRHTFFTFFPLRRAHFTVLFVELERVNHAQHFVDVTTQRQIVHNGDERCRLHRSGKNHAVQRQRPDVRYRKPAGFRV